MTTFYSVNYSKIDYKKTRRILHFIAQKKR